MNHTTPTTITDEPGSTEKRPDADDARAGRRLLLRGLALGGAGAAAGIVASGGTARAGDSGGAAIGGNAVELGITNTSDAPTIIDVTPAMAPEAGPSLFSAGGYEPAADAPFPAGVGGYGDDTIANGVHGSTTNAAGFGVVAANLAPAVEDDGDDETPLPGAPAALAVASANGPQIRFVGLPDPVVGPTPGTHVPGELYVDAEGTLWFTVPTPPAEEGGEPGVKFLKLAGTPTAGAFHPLEIPIRITDTREGPGTKLPAGSTTLFDLTKDLNGDDSGVPGDSIAIQLNVTAAQTENRGYFSVGSSAVVFPDDDATFASGNWFQNDQTINAPVTSSVAGDGQIQVKIGPEGGCHIIVDCVGFYA